MLVEIAWPILAGPVPPPHQGYALFGSLCRAGMLAHAQPNTIVLPPRSNLVIRADRDRARRLREANLMALQINEARILLGSPTIRDLIPSMKIEAWCVTIRNAMTEDSMRLVIRRQLDLMGVGDCRIGFTGRRIIRICDRSIVGFGVRLGGLTEGDSLTVQSRGLGGRLRMGCGGFVPC